MCLGLTKSVLFPLNIHLLQSAEPCIFVAKRLAQGAGLCHRRRFQPGSSRNPTTSKAEAQPPPAGWVPQSPGAGITPGCPGGRIKQRGAGAGIQGGTGRCLASARLEKLSPCQSTHGLGSVQWFMRPVLQSSIQPLMGPFAPLAPGSCSETLPSIGLGVPGGRGSGYSTHRCLVMGW